jgi:hypothetical protein
MSFAANPGGPRSESPPVGKVGQATTTREIYSMYGSWKDRVRNRRDSKSLDAIILWNPKNWVEERGERRKVCGFFFFRVVPWEFEFEVFGKFGMFWSMFPCFGGFSVEGVELSSSRTVLGTVPSHCMHTEGFHVKL